MPSLLANINNKEVSVEDLSQLGWEFSPQQNFFYLIRESPKNSKYPQDSRTNLSSYRDSVMWVTGPANTLPKKDLSSSELLKSVEVSTIPTVLTTKK